MFGTFVTLAAAWESYMQPMVDKMHRFAINVTLSIFAICISQSCVCAGNRWGCGASFSFGMFMKWAFYDGSGGFEAMAYGLWEQIWSPPFMRLNTGRVIILSLVLAGMIVAAYLVAGLRGMKYWLERAANLLVNVLEVFRLVVFEIPEIVMRGLIGVAIV
ncbi:hypothetical protein FKW77_000902 [Venturia effusa]|uniref:Uncharacterized protein n=1 Tax=Venturia effusa TaxID=50376 RepID=A0A517LRD7_9PEZI|nr:hypothetical protein FKW77_000902 [Venturia effusa]